MLVVVVLLPLSLPMDNGEFAQGGGGGGCGGPAAAAAAAVAAALAAVAAVEAVEDNLSAKAAGNESVDGRMTACDDKIGRRTTTQRPTNERRRGGGGSGGGGSARARGRRQRGGCGSLVAAHSATAAGDGRGEGKGDRRCDGDAIATECAMVTRRRWKAGCLRRYRDRGG
jgi:hypothetical protein